MPASPPSWALPRRSCDSVGMHFARIQQVAPRITRAYVGPDNRPRAASAAARTLKKREAGMLRLLANAARPQNSSALPHYVSERQRSTGRAVLGGFGSSPGVARNADAAAPRCSDARVRSRRVQDSWSCTAKATGGGGGGGGSGGGDGNAEPQQLCVPAGRGPAGQHQGGSSTVDSPGVEGPPCARSPLP
ncbi:hypothetical protein BDY21DRAFT_366336 [Lineolata rhizophorae]|uniref:Uncharacterized protein n=1 Tax=Lineolata rhizophorae TaxID=578093 RepID=A0A6A6NR71_9PEZI|nr:hypothetical protein BDY21DRAFT_366336 [Lineolata rhizophorae]